jgi:ATP-dependent Clp protease ATP-binding subunit ClpB
MASTQTIDLDTKYAPDGKALVTGAQALADERKHAQVEPVHLLARALDRDKGVAAVFKAAGAAPSEVLSESDTQMNRLAKSSGDLSYLSTGMLALLARAEKEADKGLVTTEHLLNALSQEIRGAAAVVMQTFGLGPGSLRLHMKELSTAPRDLSAGTSVSSSDLSKYTRDLSKLAKEKAFDPVIGRDLEVRRLVQILERRQKSHPLIVGEPGVGKSATVSELACRIHAQEVPQHLGTIRILELEIGAITAGAKMRGEVEERLKQVLASVRGNGEIALYIPSIDTLFAQGASSNAVGELLKPLLARGEIRVIADTTPDGLKRLEERDSAFLRRFSQVLISEPTQDQAIEILRGVASSYEKFHNVRIGDPAVVASVRLAKRYVQDRSLPDSAIDLLDEASGRKRVEIEGVPAVFDALLRRVSSLKIQIEGVFDDTDEMSVKTRGKLQKELEGLEPQIAETRSKLESRRGAQAAQTAIRKEYEGLRAELETARDKKDFAKLGELEHVRMPEVKKRLDAADAAVLSFGTTGASRDVTAENIAEVLGDWTGIPVAKMLEAESDKLMKMEERLGKRVVGQSEAVRAVARAVRRGRVGLRDPGKPIGSFLYLGPSGVGKTELAKALAEFLFDDEQSMTRLDMSEFMEKHMAQRLVGAPPGYADSEEGGFLTESVRRKPYSVILFDEVEKAHPDVFNLLLQVLDDGRLTDGRGRTADFSNTVVIMTSNIGSQRILDSDAKLFETEDGRDALRDVLLDELKKFLRPEFLNRIDDVVVFRPLSKTDLLGIVDIQLRRLEKLLADRSITLDLSVDAKRQLVEIGYEPAFGARPLKRAIVKNVQDPLAEQILANGYAPGSVVVVDCKDNTFTFAKKA